MLKSLLNLLFPDICAACSNSLVKGEETICLSCLHLLPETNYFKYKNNPIEKLFWGRAHIESASSFLFFNKGGKVQNLIHQLKYNSHKQVGFRLGQLMAIRFKEHKNFSVPDVVLPVPLHPSKQKKRGFNQCDPICEGISSVFKCDFYKGNLIRVIANPSQTKKSRYARWENVSGIFKVQYPGELQNKQVLLIDDVVTTGSTLQACVETLGKIPDIRIHVATLACA